MTKTEIKMEIQKVLDNVPENLLHDILELLKDLQNESTEQIQITHALRQILSEDKELLDRLAK
jgi:glutamyl-tRNA reductase